MGIKNIAIVPKWTKLEYDMYTFGFTREQMIDQYRSTGANLQRILEGHERQKQAYHDLSRYCNDAFIVERDKLVPGVFTDTDLVITLGGDNHTTYASHFFDPRRTIMLPLNSDPLSSEGALTTASIENCIYLMNDLKNGNYEVERWTRLESLLNGVLVTQGAMSEIYIGKTKRRATSRYLLTVGGKTEEQKSSGIIITTGGGTTGWYDSESQDLHPEGNKFPKTERRARYFVTAPFRGKLTSITLREGDIFPGEEIQIHSLKDTQELSIDPVEDDTHCYPLNLGATATVRIAQEPLQVMKVTKPQQASG